MTLQRWRSRLVEELLRQGLPKKQVDRLVEELTDHAEDVLSENQSIDADQALESRLGSPAQLAAVAKEEFKQSTFAGRHPLLTFVVGPIATALGIFAITLLVIAFVTWSASLIDPEIETNPISSAQNAIVAYRICQTVSLFFRFVPFVLSAWVFVTLSRRTGLHSWSFLACLVVAVSAFCFKSVAVLQSQPDRRVYIHVDLSHIDLIDNLNFTQIMQAIVPLAFGTWLYWRCSRNSRSVPSVQ
jgi:hypothetical protein